jgi:hypothetical protein
MINSKVVKAKDLVTTRLFVLWTYDNNCMWMEALVDVHKSQMRNVILLTYNNRLIKIKHVIREIWNCNQVLKKSEKKEINATGRECSSFISLTRKLKRRRLFSTHLVLWCALGHALLCMQMIEVWWKWLLCSVNNCYWCKWLLHRANDCRIM